MDLASSGTFTIREFDVVFCCKLINKSFSSSWFQVLTVDVKPVPSCLHIAEVRSVHDDSMLLPSQGSLSESAIQLRSIFHSVSPMFHSRTSYVSCLEAAEFLRPQKVTGQAATRQGHVLRAFQWAGEQAGRQARTHKNRVRQYSGNDTLTAAASRSLLGSCF